MPIKQAAKKALRQSTKRQTHNLALRNTYKWLVNETLEQVAAKEPKKAVETLAKAVQAVDKAAKQHVIHKNKAARIKSRLDRAVHGLTKKK